MRPLAVTSLIEERLSVVDLFKEYPTLAAALQSGLRRLPDAERLLPRAARALQSLLARAGFLDEGAASMEELGEGLGASAFEEGAGSQDAWLEGLDGDGLGSAFPHHHHPDHPKRHPYNSPYQHQQQQQQQQQPLAATPHGRQQTWRKSLQERQQVYKPQQPPPSPSPQLPQQYARSASAVRSGVDDPADGTWVDAQNATAWKAVRQLPGTLSGLIEAVAILRRHMAQLHLSSSKLPLIHKAVVEAAKCSEAVAAIARVLGGAEWATTAVQGVGGGSNTACTAGDSTLGGLRLAAGADEAYDAACQRMTEAEAQLAQATREVLTMFGGAGGSFTATGLTQRKQQAGGKLRQQQQAKSSKQATVVDPLEGLIKVPAANGAKLQSNPQFEFAGHSPDPASILVRCAALQQLATSHAAAARARAAAAAAAVGAAAGQLLGSYSALAALIHAVADLDVLAGFAAVTDAARAPVGVGFCRPTFVSAAADGAGAAGGATATPPLHLKGLW